MSTDSRNDDSDESPQYQLRQAEIDKGTEAVSTTPGKSADSSTNPNQSHADALNEDSEAPDEGRRTMSKPAVVRLLVGVVFMMAGLAYCESGGGGGELTFSGVFLGLIGLAFIAPGLLLIVSSLFGIKKRKEVDLAVESDKAESTTKKVAKGCGTIALIIVAGLFGLYVLIGSMIFN